MKLHAATSTDGYKISHGSMYPTGTEYVYSNLTPRGDRHYVKNATSAYDGRLVWVGAQGMVKEITENWEKFFSMDRNEAINKYAKRLDGYLGGFDSAVEKMSALHDLQYLPLLFKSLPEGCKVPMGVPVLTVTNTHPDFFWLVNYLETSISALTWKTATTATVAAEYKAICNHYAELTGTDDFTVSVQCHDFSMRGMSGIEDAARSGFGHLTQFIGTDSLVAMDYADDYYNSGDDLLAISVPATEHAVATSNILFNENECSQTNRLDAEMDFLEELITERFPTGIISYVSDSYDFWSVITKVLPLLKDVIMARQPSAVAPAKLVCRPDSGNPVKVITGHTVLDMEFDTEEEFYAHTDTSCTFYHVSSGKEVVKVGGQYRTFDMVDPSRYGLGYIVPEWEVMGAVECLWSTFGGTETDRGFKLLDSHIGLIYGDSITPQRAEQILHRLMEKGFASGNVVLGVGSMSYQFHTRDTFGFAVKATHITVNGVGLDIFKDPKGESSKKSAKGLLYVRENDDGVLELIDGVSPEMEAAPTNMLQPLWKDNTWLKRESLTSIRERVKKYM